MPMYADEIKGPCADEHAELEKAWAECDRLKAVNAELVEALENARDALDYSLSVMSKDDPLWSKVQVTWKAANYALAKVKGESLEFEPQQTSDGNGIQRCHTCKHTDDTCPSNVEHYCSQHDYDMWEPKQTSPTVDGKNQ